jgi:hypothetical protein
MVFGVWVVAVARLTGPERVLVELEEFIVGSCVFAASEDHRAETAVADGEGVDPLGRRFIVREGEVAGC